MHGLKPLLSQFAQSTASKSQLAPVGGLLRLAPILSPNLQSSVKNGGSTHELCQGREGVVYACFMAFLMRAPKVMPSGRASMLSACIQKCLPFSCLFLPFFPNLNATFRDSFLYLPLFGIGFSCIIDTDLLKTDETPQDLNREAFFFFLLPTFCRGGMSNLARGSAERSHRDQEFGGGSI